MQHTKKKQFNILETSDPFSPEPLNQNTLKVEEALAAQEEALQTASKALSDRISVFEAKHFVCGFFRIDNDTDADLQLGFTPRIVYAHIIDAGGLDILATPDDPLSVSRLLYIVDGGFKVNGKGLYQYAGTYTYIAFD